MRAVSRRAPATHGAGARRCHCVRLNYKDDADAARRFIGALGNPYTRIGADTRGRVAIDFGVYGVPETFVIDGTGRIVSRFAGPLARASLESDILPHLDLQLEASQ